MSEDQKKIWRPNGFSDYLKFYQTPESFSVPLEVTSEFISSWDQNAEVSRELAKQYHLVFVRGLFGDYMRDNLIGPHNSFFKLGFLSELAPVRSGGGVFQNGERISKWFRKKNTRKKFLFLAHSKGGLDVLAALASHPELQSRTAGLALVQAPVGPSAVMDSILHNTYPQSRDAMTAVKERVYRLLIHSTFHGDGCRSISTPEVHMRNKEIFSKKFPFPILSVISWSIYPTLVLDAFHKRLSQIRPGHANDGQLFIEDQKVPEAESILLPHLDHAQPALGNAGFDSIRFWKTLFFMLHRRILSLLIITFLVGRIGLAFEVDARGGMQLGFYGREINASPQYASYSSTLDGFYQFESLVRARQSDFQLEAEPEILGLVGRSSSLANTDAAHLSVAPPVRFLNMSALIQSNQTGQSYFDMNRLDLSYSSEHVTGYVGRKPVSLGVLKVFPVWNKFSRPPPVVSGPALIFGEDAANVRAQFGAVAFQALQVQGFSSTNTASIGEGTWYASFGEIHLLDSYWWQEQVAGVAGAFDLGGATLRFESLFIGLSPTDMDRQIQLGVGAEYAFDEKWSAILEGIYQSTGVSNSNAYSLQLSSRYLSLQAEAYAFGRVDYKASPYWTLTLGDFFNCVDGSSILVARLEYSITENLDLLAEFDIPVGAQGTELSTQAYNFPGGNFVGAPYQGSVTLKSSF